MMSAGTGLSCNTLRVGVTQVLSHMTKKRAINVNRAEFILQSEAFAHLVRLECVKLDGM